MALFEMWLEGRNSSVERRVRFNARDRPFVRREMKSYMIEYRALDTSFGYKLLDLVLKHHRHHGHLSPNTW